MNKSDLIHLQVLEAEDIARTLAQEALIIIKEFSNEQEINTYQRVVSLYLSYVIQELMDEALSDEKITGDTKEKKYNKAKKNFLATKSNIEFSVSDGFQKALKKFSGEHVAYCCLIAPVAQPVNKFIM